eukprot:14906703-Alexandrium_andersonii.AAC.1
MCAFSPEAAGGDACGDPRGLYKHPHPLHPHPRNKHINFSAALVCMSIRPSVRLPFRPSVSFVSGCAFLCVGGGRARNCREPRIFGKLPIAPRPHPPPLPAPPPAPSRSPRRPLPVHRSPAPPRSPRRPHPSAPRRVPRPPILHIPPRFLPRPIVRPFPLPHRTRRARKCPRSPLSPPPLPRQMVPSPPRPTCLRLRNLRAALNQGLLSGATRHLTINELWGRSWRARAAFRGRGRSCRRR